RPVRSGGSAAPEPGDRRDHGRGVPVSATEGAWLRRAAHTEAGCDLARLAGLTPASVICEVMNPDGSMARRPDLEAFARQHGLKIGTIMDLIHYRMAHEATVERTREYRLPTAWGDFNVVCYRDLYKDGPHTHLALVKGEIRADEPVLARVLVTDTIRDLLGVENPLRPSWSLHQSLERISQEGSGVVVVLANEMGSGDVVEQLERFNAMVEGDPAAAAPRGSYLTVGTGSQILRDLGVGKMRLLSFPTKYAISGFDLEVVEFIPKQPS